MKTTVWYLLVICLIKVREMVNYIFAEIFQKYWDFFSRWRRRLTKYSSCNSLFVCQSVRDGLDRQADEQTGQIMKQETGEGVVGADGTLRYKPISFWSGLEREHCPKNEAKKELASDWLYLHSVLHSLKRSSSTATKDIWMLLLEYHSMSWDVIFFMALHSG